MARLVIAIKRIKPWQITLLTFGMVMAFYMLTILRYPEPFFDEPLYISRAWAVLNPGRVSDLWAAGAFDRFDGYWTVLSWIMNGALIFGLFIAGSPTLLAARMITLFFGFLLLLSIYWIGKKLGGFPVAILAVILVAMSRSFLVSSHMVRPDIIGAAFGYAAIALYLNNSLSKRWISLSSGLLATLAFDVHANGLIFTPTILALFLLHDLYFYKQKTFWWFCLGVVIGVGFYLASHVLPYPETYKAIMVNVYGKLYFPPILQLNPIVLLQGLIYYWNHMIRRYVLLFPICVISLVILLRRRSPIDTTLIILVVMILLCFGLLVSNKSFAYEIYYETILQILLAYFLYGFICRPRVKTLRYRFFFVYIWTAYLSISLVNIIPAVMNNLYPVYETIQQRVNESIKPGDVIMSSQIYWLGLSDHTYYSWEQIAFDRLIDPNSTLENNFKKIKLDVIIYDGQMLGFTTNDPSRLAYSGLLYIPKTELDTFLAKYAILVDEFDGLYGIKKIYRIQW